MTAPAERGATGSQGDLLGRALAAGGLVVGAGVLTGLEAPPAAAAPSAGLDVKILNFALLLEHLQAAFYREAVRRGSLKGELRQFAEIVGGHELEHAAFVRRTLGAKARKRPSFDFGDSTASPRRFARTALLLEDAGVAALNGQAPNLTPGALAAAAKIVSVEARHASWIRDIVGEIPAPDAADVPRNATQVTATLRRTGFVKSA